MELPFQAHVICKNGVYLSERSEGDLLVALYGVFDFYAEVYYRLKSGGTIRTLFYENRLK